MNWMEAAETTHLVASSGNVVEATPVTTQSAVRAVAVTRLGWLHHYSQDGLVLLQLRGCSQVEATEGCFDLARRDWIAFDPDSRQKVRANREGLAVGLILPRRLFTALPDHGGLLPGRGRMPVQDILIGLRLWRAYQAAAAEPRHLSTLLLHLGHQQASMQALANRCPGRTAARRWHVLSRMQRVRMTLQGNLDRPVRLAELSALSRFSEWWVSKTYRAIYGQNIQEASQSMRMQRACALLAYTDLSIGEIGEACGFLDPCSFARLFKQRHGDTASRWRARQKARRQLSPSQPPYLPSAVFRTAT